MAPCQDFLECRAAGVLAQFFYVSNRLLDVTLSSSRIGDKPGHPPAAPRNDDGLAALDLVEQLVQPRLGCRCLNFFRLSTVDLAAIYAAGPEGQLQPATPVVAMD
jgi:hypothetical protein